LNKDKDKKAQSTAEETEENANEDRNEDITIKLHPPTCSEIKRAQRNKIWQSTRNGQYLPRNVKLDIETSVNLLHLLLTEIWKE
jgi:hypothetical protein